MEDQSWGKKEAGETCFLSADGARRVPRRINERLDDLQRGGYFLIQNPTTFCFGMDAVLLSAFAQDRTRGRVLDMCSGNGIVAILLAARCAEAQIEAIEIQSEMAEMACRSIALNGLRERVHMRQGDIREAASLYGRASFDVVTCNPPYMSENHGLKNPQEPKAIARHELQCRFSDVARSAAEVLKVGGRLYLVHRPQRLAELIFSLKEQKLEPKRLRMVHPFATAEANMVLLEAVRGGAPGLRVLPPLIVYREIGVYTDEINRLYYE